MLLVIFGAGASYDSVHDRPSGVPFKALRTALAADHPDNARPPLANQLFDNRPLFVDAMTRFRECMPLVPLLRKEGVVVEKELARLQAQADKFPRAKQELAAIRYYLHFALWECQLLWQKVHRGITNHLTLVREIERWRHEYSEKVCFVTFNYDTMLEDAIQEFQRAEIKSLDGYLALGQYMVIKLHGSINWGFDVDIDPQGYTPHRIIQEVASLRITSRMRLVTDHPMTQQDGHLVFPAVSIPVENKDEFACPPDHVKALAEMLPKVTKILTVGWRATEADFLNMLKSRLTGLTGRPSLMVVSGCAKDAQETYTNLTRPLAPDRRPSVFDWYAPIESGFTGLITNIGAFDTFLRAACVS